MFKQGLNLKHLTREGGETRRTPRRVYNRPIGVLSHGKYMVVQAMQLSEGGLLFLADEGFVKGDRLIATLIMPGGGAVVARGEIAYEKNEPTGKTFGVRFEPLALNVRRWIRNYVTAKTQHEAEAEMQDSFADMIGESKRAAKRK